MEKNLIAASCARKARFRFRLYLKIRFIKYLQSFLEHQITFTFDFQQVFAETQFFLQVEIKFLKSFHEIQNWIALKILLLPVYPRITFSSNNLTKMIMFSF